RGRRPRRSQLGQHDDPDIYHREGGSVAPCEQRSASIDILVIVDPDAPEAGRTQPEPEAEGGRERGIRLCISPGIVVAGGAAVVSSAEGDLAIDMIAAADRPAPHLGDGL